MHLFISFNVIHILLSWHDARVCRIEHEQESFLQELKLALHVDEAERALVKSRKNCLDCCRAFNAAMIVILVACNVVMSCGLLITVFNWKMPVGATTMWMNLSAISFFVLVVAFGPCVVVNQRWALVEKELKFNESGGESIFSADKIWLTQLIKIHRLESDFCGVVPQMCWVISAAISAATLGIGQLNTILSTRHQE